MDHFSFAIVDHFWIAIYIFAVLALAVSSCKSQNEPEQPQETPLITIDGKYQDWDALVKENKASVAMLDGSKTYAYTQLLKLMVYADKSSIYFMVLFDDKNAKPLDIFFATKGEVPTNAINLWNPCYVDYCIEFGKGDTFVDDPADMDWSNWKYQQLMAYDHQKGGWNWNYLGQNMVTLSDKNSVGGYAAVEGKVARSTFEFTTAYFYIGAYLSDKSWKTIGAQPAAEKTEDTVILPEMLKVQLP